MINGNWFEVITDIEKVLDEPLRALDFRNSEDRLRERAIVTHTGANGQDIGAEPTKMYETYLLYNTISMDEKGLYLTDYAEDLEKRYGNIWDLDPNETDQMAENMAAAIEGRIPILYP